MKQAEQEELFLGLVEAHKHIIYKVCFMYASGDENISDMFQETVLNMWKAFPKFRGKSRYSTWVYRIAVNTCVSWLRTSKKQPQTMPFTLSMSDLITDEQEKENLKSLKEFEEE